MQSYLILQSTDTLSNSRYTLNNALQSAISNFEGTTFPTVNTYIGQMCYRSDQQKLYLLSSKTPVTWTCVGNIGQNYIGQSDADARYHRQGVMSRGDLRLQGAASGSNDNACIYFYDNSGYMRYQMYKSFDQNFYMHRYDAAGVYVDTPLHTYNGELRSKGNTIWHSGNDGVGSGLDADKIDGVSPGSFGLALLQTTSAQAAASAIGVVGVPTGAVIPMYTPWNTPLPGYVQCDGQTIGNASSAATSRKNNDTWTLFNWLWQSNDQLVISGGRGSSALADWNANKTIALPDLRGRSLFGLDMNTGRIGANLTDLSNASATGAVGGASMVTLDTSTMPYHSHATIDGWHNHAMSQAAMFTSSGHWAIGGSGNYTQFDNVGATTVMAPSNVTVDGAGSGGAHQNMPPFMIINFYIKL